MIVFYALIFGLLFVFTDAAVDTFIIGHSDFLSALFANDLHKLWMRSYVLITALGFGGLGQYFLSRTKQAELVKERISENDQLNTVLLQRQEAYLRSILDTVLGGIITIDQHGIIQTFNPAAESIFGYKFDEVDQHSINMLMPKPHQDQHDEYLNRYLETGKANIIGIAREVIGLRKDGSTFPMDLAVSEAQADKITMFTGIVRDITERKRVELELLESKESAESANQAKSEFLSSMSHELRTPLNAILGFAQLLEVQSKKEQISNERVQEYSSHILNGGEHLLGLINEVLDLSRIESGYIKVELEPVLLTEVVTECIEQIKVALADQRNISLIDQSRHPDLNVLTDPQRLRQVIINLLSNAVKYNREGGAVTVESELMGEDRLRIIVTDTGMGIAARDIDKLFDPFERLTFKHGQIEGSGIGLTVTKRLVEAMGGNIGVESTINKGSSFWVELPLATHINQAMEVERTALPESPSPKINKETKHTILYIEDNPTNVELMKVVLNNKGGFELLTSLTAEDGLTLAEEKIPDVILMDINLPGIDGITALKILRNVEATSKIPVIAVSGAAMDSDIEAAQAAGFDDYISKPFDLEHLYAVIEKHLTDSTTT